jgi:hypothetical protein
MGILLAVEVVDFSAARNIILCKGGDIILIQEDMDEVHW